MPVNQVNHTSWVAVVTPTDRPKSVRNRCVIELFAASFVLSLCPFDISVGVGAFVIGLSQISSFFSYKYMVLLHPYICIFFLKHCTLTNKAVGATGRPCSNLCRVDKVPRFVPFDC